MNNEFEKYGKIVSAALKNDNKIYYCRDGHHSIFPMEELGVLRNAKQGFVTENGYFVNREIGLLIATYYNQIENKYPPVDSLNSEDLKKDYLELKEKVKTYQYNEKIGIRRKN